MKLDWRDVLNPNHNWHGSRDTFYMSVVKPSGYPYFMWNGRIYKNLKNNDLYEETGYTDEIVS